MWAPSDVRGRGRLLCQCTLFPPHLHRAQGWGAPPPLGHMVSCKYVCMYVRLCCCKYLSWVPGQLQKRLLREEEAPLYLLVTARTGTRSQAPGPSWHRGRPDSPSPGSSPLQGCSYPTCVHLPHTLTTENRVSGTEQTAPGAGGGAECWSVPRAPRSTGLLPRPLQSPLTNRIYTLC